MGYAYKEKNKNSETILNLLQQFYKDTDNKVKFLEFDKGSEFNNNKIIEWINNNNIKYYFVGTADKHSMGLIERFNKTIKTKLIKIFSYNNNVIWYNIIDDLINNYNTVHSSINEKPIDMTENYETIEEIKK